MLLQIRIGSAVMLAGVLLAAESSAQIPVVPQADGSNQKTTLTKEQIRGILMLRGLQTRGSRRGVQRGVPQFVPFGNPWFMGVPMNAPQAAGDNADPKRAARTNRLRQAREEAVAKREEAAKKRAEARANAKGKAAAKAKAKARSGKNDPA